MVVPRNLVNLVAWPPVVVTLKPGNRIDVVPAAAGKLLVSVTVTVSPSFTISVGAGTCIAPHEPAMLTGANVAPVPSVQP